MHNLNRCPRCLAPLREGESPRGLCPSCLLAIAMGEEEHLRGPGGRAAPEPPRAADLARAFPELEVGELIGRGGMGVVFRARQRDLGREVALKLLAVDPELEPSLAERFVREARALAALDHQSIVRVYSGGRREQYLFLLMEFVDGVNLRQAIRAQRLVPREILAITSDICAALDYAHQQGVVHRDIKPENVLITKLGRVKIADFGLAKLLAGENYHSAERLTQSSQAMGTPHYMAPEQIEHPLAVDHRADIYSLGVVLYELLTGELPLGRFAPPSRKVQVDLRLDDVVLRTLEKEPERRYQRAGEVKTALDAIAQSPSVKPAAARSKWLPGRFYSDGVEGYGWKQEPSRGCCGCLFLGVLLLIAAYILLTPVEIAPSPSQRSAPRQAPATLDTPAQVLPQKD